MLVVFWELSRRIALLTLLCAHFSKATLMKIAKLIPAVAIASVAAMFATSASATDAANLITNGDFEHNAITVDTGNHYSKVGENSTDITGWTVGPGSVDLI